MHINSISFIGAGNIASAIITGLITQGYEAKKIIAARRNTEKLSQLQQQYGIKTTNDNLIAAHAADMIVFAVKPQQFDRVCQQLRTIVKKQKPLIVSVVAGKTIAGMHQHLGAEAAIVRCMANTPAQIGYSATAAFANRFITAQQQQQVDAMLNAIGTTVWLKREAALDVVTALAGSGPAYYFYIMDAFINAATQQGLDADVAKVLAEQTALGAAKMAQSTHDTLTTLRQQIASPGGTTAQGIKVLQDHHVDNILAAVIAKATQRATELARI